MKKIRTKPFRWWHIFKAKAIISTLQYYLIENEKLAESYVDENKRNRAKIKEQESRIAELESRAIRLQGYMNETIAQNKKLSFQVEELQRKNAEWFSVFTGFAPYDLTWLIPERINSPQKHKALVDAIAVEAYEKANRIDD